MHSALIFLSNHTGSPVIFPGNNMMNKLARLNALVWQNIISRSLSFTSCILSSVLPNWRPTILSEFFDRQLSSDPPKILMLLHHARYVLSRVLCNGLSLLLNSYLSRAGRIKNPSSLRSSNPEHFLSRYVIFS